MNFNKESDNLPLIDFKDNKMEDNNIKLLKLNDSINEISFNKSKYIEEGDISHLNIQEKDNIYNFDEDAIMRDNNSDHNSQNTNTCHILNSKELNLLSQELKSIKSSINYISEDIQSLSNSNNVMKQSYYKVFIHDFSIFKQDMNDFINNYNNNHII